MPEPRSRSERLVARAYLGPFGHLWGVVADLAELTARSVLARVRRRTAA